MEDNNEVGDDVDTGIHWTKPVPAVIVEGVEGGLTGPEEALDEVVGGVVGVLAVTGGVVSKPNNPPNFRLIFLM